MWKPFGVPGSREATAAEGVGQGYSQKANGQSTLQMSVLNWGKKEKKLY